MVQGSKRRAVFLDRDGVLNQAIVREGRPYAPNTMDGIQLIPGAAEACARLKQAGFLLVMVTNQPEVSRGTITLQTVDGMNQLVAKSVGLDVVKLCPHDDAERCSCRKPLPGLLLETANEHNVDLNSSYLVGDRWRDVAAGRGAGCKTIFIDYGYAEKQAENPDFVTGSLTAAAAWILDAERSGRN